MTKLNESLRSKLVFERREIADNIGDGQPGTHVIISTTYDGIYRQYSYINYPTDLKGMPQDAAQLEEEAKNLLTQIIDRELSKKYVRCRSCGSHIMHHFEKSTTHKCDNCGEVNEIKVLIERK